MDTRTKVKAAAKRDGGRTTFWKAYSKVTRLEYLPAEILLILIPVFLIVRTPEEVMNPIFAEAVVIFFLLYFTGFMANALADRDVDARYRSYKSTVAMAVDHIGTSKMTVILATHMIVALLLSFHLFALTSNILILFFVGLGLFLGVGYSFEPFKFKTKGAAHGLALATSAFFLPLAFLIVVLAGRLDFISLLFITGFTMAMYSLEFGNQAMDYFEDKESDLSTPSVRYSVKRTLKFALILLPFGLFLTMVSLVTMSITKLHLIHPALTDWVVVLIVSSLLLIGFARPAIGLKRVHDAYASTSPGPERERMRKVLKEIDHPGWQASGALGVVLVCGMMFASAFFSFSVPRPGGEPSINEGPEVRILNNPDQIVNVGEQVYFEAEVHDDGEVVSMIWDFGDGTGTGGSNNATHIYHLVGVYKVNITVRDEVGNRANHWINLTVTDLNFSKLEFTAQRFITFTRIYYDYNVTNDKYLKYRDELVVKVYYANFQKLSQGLDFDLKPAKVWHKNSYFDIPPDNDPLFRVMLLQYIDDELIVIEDRIVNAK